MKMIWLSVRALVLVLTILATIAASLTRTYAHPPSSGRHGDTTRVATPRPCSPPFCDQRTGPQRLTDPGLENGTFLGQITALIGPASNPTRFTIQLGTDVVDVRLAAKTTITGKSAEADVEGLVRGDYAIVRAKKVNRIWFATRIIFDVQPIAPLRMISGTILRVYPDGKHFSLRPDIGKGIYFVRVVRQTRFTLDTRPGDSLSTVVKGAVVQILCRRIDGAWTAYTINARSAI